MTRFARYLAIGGAVGDTRARRITSRGAPPKYPKYPPLWIKLLEVVATFLAVLAALGAIGWGLMVPG